MGQLAQTFQNHSKDSFSSDTKKNPKDYMAITQRSGKELQVGNEIEKRQTDNEDKSENHNQACNEKR